MLRNIVLWVLFLAISPLVLFANQYVASLGQMPLYAESKDKGVLVDLVKAMAKVSDNQIKIKVLPFTSSVYMAQKGKVDFHMPLIENDIISPNDLPFLYSKETVFQVNFVLYTKKGSDVNLNNLDNKKIETDRAHVNYFPFKTIASNSIEKSLAKVHNGSIDGFVFADFATDPYLKKASYKNIQRSLYKVFNSKMILPKTKEGEQTDVIVSKAITDLRKNGELKRIVQSIDLPYNNWQP